MSAIAWRKLVIASMAGLACGKGYVWLRRYPDTMRPILYCSALSGGAGVVLGFGVAAWRGLPSHIYALSTGANFAVITAAFLGMRHVILQPLVNNEGSQTTLFTLQQAEYMSSGAGGGIAVTIATILSKRGIRSILLSGCVGVGLGLLTQLFYFQFERWRVKKAIEIHYPELSEQEEHDWTWAKFEARFMNFWHRRSRAIQTDTDIALLKEAIKNEEKRIKQLNQLLPEKDTTPSAEDSTQTINGSRIIPPAKESSPSAYINLPDTR